MARSGGAIWATSGRPGGSTIRSAAPAAIKRRASASSHQNVSPGLTSTVGPASPVNMRTGTMRDYAVPSAGETCNSATCVPVTLFAVRLDEFAP